MFESKPSANEKNVANRTILSPTSCGSLVRLYRSFNQKINSAITNGNAETETKLFRPQ